MSRSVAEWIGRTDNSAVPPRVKARLYMMANGKCQHCTRFIDGRKLTAEYDHITALINLGKNCETNLQLLCQECHLIKSGADVAIKSKDAKVRAKHIGIKTNRRKIQSAGFARAEPQHTATRPIEKRT